jgi:hypothetical protein
VEAVENNVQHARRDVHWLDGTRKSARAQFAWLSPLPKREGGKGDVCRCGRAIPQGGCCGQWSVSVPLRLRHRRDAEDEGGVDGGDARERGGEEGRAQKENPSVAAHKKRKE